VDSCRASVVYRAMADKFGLYKIFSKGSQHGAWDGAGNSVKDNERTRKRIKEKQKEKQQWGWSKHRGYV